MKPLRVVLAALLLALAVAVLVLRLGEQRPPAPPRPAPTSAPVSRVGAAPPAVDVSRLRDVFRYADEPLDDASDREQAGPPSANARGFEPPLPPAGPHLVGVVRRGGRLLAALASQDGEVELAAPGESAAGATVLLVEQDAVRVRLPDGAETTLLPAE